MTLPPAICERLRVAYGLDTATLGESAQRAALRRRQAATRSASLPAYEALLGKSPDEFDALAEELLVPESWFFRDGAPFKFLEFWARDVWTPAAAGRALRVLSVPCAAGQEPYSIAMTLLDAGLARGQFSILAGDVSARVLEQARAAVYGDSAFRGRSAAGREHHFELAGPAQRRVRESVRGTVRFQRCNLVEPEFGREDGPFEVIFCRNVLIYFSPAARQRVLDNLRRVLAPDGFLFTGHADGLLFLDAGFVSAGPPEAFVFRRRPPSASAEARPAPTRRRTGRTRSPVRNSTPGFPARSRPPAAAPVAATTATLAKSLLVEARRHADAGLLDDAERLCRETLKTGQFPPDAYFLLGQIAGARGRMVEAEKLYRQALYLDPRHDGALAQLALLAERRGDRSAATRLRQRAKA